MPQPPNLQKMLAEAQAMLAAQQEAQEKLKEQKVEATRRRRHGQGRDDRRPADREPRRSTPTRSTPRTSRCCRTWSSPPINEAIRKAEELQQSQLGGAEQGGFDPMSALESLGLGGMGGMGGGGGGSRAARPGGAPNRAARRAQKKRQVDHR